MDVQRWQQVDKIFQAALEREPGERAAFLDEACWGDPQLRSQIEAMLSSDEQGCDLLEGNAFEAAADLLAEDQPELAAGERVGHYSVLGLLGAGGMGEVYLAEDTRLGRKVALKLLPASYTRSESRLRRFQQEARAASALNHPNILTIHDIWEIEGQHLIATEYIEGETLRQRLKRGKLSREETLDLSIQVASALWAAHQAGIVHRDIKPENIMLRRDGYVKVLDFGLAKLTEQKERTPHARVADNLDLSSGLVMGTVRYMSPEQARGQPVDPRSDIFSFGVVLYEMLAGRAPFAGETASELVAAILKKEPPPLSGVPDELQRLVSRALRKKKEERYQAIQDLLDDLKALRENKAITGGGKMAAQSAEPSALSTTDTMPISTASTITSIVSGIKRHKTSAAFILASLVVVAIGLTFGLSRFNRQRTPSNQMRIARLPNMDKADEVAISPDGKYIAQTARNAGQYGIWLVELWTDNSVPVLISPAKNFVSGLTFSKDSEKIFYVSDRALYQVSVRGGDATKVMADVDDSLSIAPDEQQVAFVRTRDSDHEMALTIVNVDGSGERVLATRKGPEFIGLPAWSPDGKLIACSFGLNASNRTESLIAFEVATGQEKQITTQRWQGFTSVAWLPDGSGLVAAAKETFGGPTQIWQVSYPDGEVRRITNDLENYGNLSLTADGKTLVAFQLARRSSLWVTPKENPSGARPITSSERMVYRAVSFTPDGRILYPFSVNGNQNIWIMNADGTNPKQLTADAGVNVLARPSPDGRYIVFASNRANQGAFNIWRMDIDGSNPIQLTYGSGESGPACSPDGLWVVYSKGGPEVLNAQKTLWKVPIDGGEPVQVTNTPSNGAAFSPDGTLIACWYKQDAASPWQLAIIPFTGGPPIKLFNAPRVPILWPRWTPDGQAISYIYTSEGVSNIWSQPISGGPPQPVTQFTSEEIEGFDWSRDGTLICSRLHSTQDVLLITDFR